jgi:hypothetical protein
MAIAAACAVGFGLTAPAEMAFDRTPPVPAVGSLPPCFGGGVIPDDLDTIPWVHKVTRVPVAHGKPCADSVPYVDLSDEMPPVGDQQWQNCCTAWGFGYYHRTHVEFLERRWDLTDSAHQGSPAFIYNQINGGRNGGSQFSRAMALMTEQGCGTLTDCPYDSGDYLTWPTEQAYRNAMMFRADSAFWFDVHDTNFVNLIRQHLANGNSCVTGIVIYSNFWNIHQYGNIYTLADMRGNPISGLAVTIVGYDDTMRTRDGTGAFRLVNSMGTAWGDSGYFWMSYQATADTRIVYGYACYVTDRIGYQPRVIGTVRLQHPTRDRVGIRFGVGSPERSLWHQDFRSWRLVHNDYPFPATRLAFDLTDGADWLVGNGADSLYVACVDDTADGRTGFIREFEVEHLEWMTTGYSSDPPVAIPDGGDTAYAVLCLPFTGVAERSAGSRQKAGLQTATVVRGVLNLGVDSRQHTAYRAELLDISGRVVLTLKPGANDVRGLAPGAYFVREAKAHARVQAVRRVVIPD